MATKVYTQYLHFSQSMNKIDLKQICAIKTSWYDIKAKCRMYIACTWYICIWTAYAFVVSRMRKFDLLVYIYIVWFDLKFKQRSIWRIYSKILTFMALKSFHHSKLHIDKWIYHMKMTWFVITCIGIKKRAFLRTNMDVCSCWICLDCWSTNQATNKQLSLLAWYTSWTIEFNYYTFFLHVLVSI